MRLACAVTVPVAVNHPSQMQFGEPMAYSQRMEQAGIEPAYLTAGIFVKAFPITPLPQTSSFVLLTSIMEFYHLAINLL